MFALLLQDFISDVQECKIKPIFLTEIAVGFTTMSIYRIFFPDSA